MDLEFERFYNFVIILGGYISMKTTFISKENNDVKFTMDFSAEEFEA